MKSLFLAAASLSLIACTATQHPADSAEQPAEGLGSPIQTDAAYSVYELSYERDGMTIYGNLYLPTAGSAPYPIVVMAHGFDSSYEYATPYAEDLAAEGIASYAFDFCGGSVRSKSGGNTTDMSVLTEERDMETVLDGILAESFTDKSRVFIMGESQGGFVTSLVGERRADDVRGMVLLYPALVIPDDARQWYPSRDDIPDTAAMGEMTVGRIYYEDVYDMDVFSEIGSFAKPVLILHGDADRVVPLSYSERASQTYSDCKLHVVNGAGHGFYGRTPEQSEASGEIIAFLKNLL